MMKLSRSKDFWAGLIYVAVAAAILWIGRDYTAGSPGRMGPGYFPRILAIGLMLLGFGSLFLAMTRPLRAIDTPALKPLLLISAALLLFGWLLQPLGFVVALVVLIVLSAAASERFGFDLKVMLGLAAFVAVCAVMFVKLLGVPMPLIGDWLQPALARF